MVELNGFISATLVSTVLNRDVKQFGKKYLFDQNDDTCWNSDQGEIQHITVKFDREVTITDIHIQFQGGFSCKQFDILLLDQTEENLPTSCYPEDVNILQKFNIEKSKKSTKVRLLFSKNTDFFGRVIIYHLRFYGHVD